MNEVLESERRTRNSERTYLGKAGLCISPFAHVLYPYYLFTCQHGRDFSFSRQERGFKGLICRVWTANPVVYYLQKSLHGREAGWPGLWQLRTGLCVGGEVHSMESQRFWPPGPRWRLRVRVPAWSCFRSCPEDFWEKQEDITRKGWRWGRHQMVGWRSNPQLSVKW